MIICPCQLSSRKTGPRFCCCLTVKLRPAASACESQNFCPRKPGPYWGHGVNPNPPAVASLIYESTPIHCGKDASVPAKLTDQTCKHPVSLGSRKACLLSSTASMSYYDMRSVSGEETCYVDSGLGRSGCRRGLSLGRVLSWKKCKKSHKYQCSLRMLAKMQNNFR